jgi:hypothetical protein
MRQVFIVLLAGAALLLAAMPLSTPRIAWPFIVQCQGVSGPWAEARDWIGSLQGWPDSCAALAWRAAVKRAKGEPVPTAYL